MSGGVGQHKEFSLQTVIYSAICLTLFASLYTPAYRVMVRFWDSEDYNHCYLVPLIVLYLVWEKRSAFRNAPLVPSWSAIVPLTLGIVLYWLGELGGEYYTLYFSSWLIMVAMVWLYAGWRKLKTIGFALCFLITMFPFPSFVTNNLTLRLKLISSQLGVVMLQLIGQSAYREGNIIDLGFTRLQVVDACSGLRFFLPLFILGILVAHFYRAAWWKRLLLIIATVPLSIFTNSVRIASVGILYKFIGPRAAEGFFHDFSGWLIFMVSLALLLALMWLLKHFLPEKEQGEENEENPVATLAAVNSNSNPDFGYVIIRLVPVIVLLGGTLLVMQQIDFREKVPPRKPFADFPVQVGEWRGTRQTMEKIYLDALDLTDYAMIDYRNGSSNQAINLYVAYNASQTKGKSSHSPASCLPGSGWEFKDSGIATVDLPGGKSISIKRAVMEQNGQQQLVYYWFPQRGRVLHNLFELKLYVFWDALVTRRTDGALVRIITPVSDPLHLGEADARLQGFVRAVLPDLECFIAGKII